MERRTTELAANALRHQIKEHFKDSFVTLRETSKASEAQVEIEKIQALIDELVDYERLLSIPETANV